MITHNLISAEEMIRSLSGCKGKIIAMSNKNGGDDAYAQVEERFGVVD